MVWLQKFLELSIPTPAKEFDSRGALRSLIFKSKLPRNLQSTISRLGSAHRIHLQVLLSCGRQLSNIIKQFKVFHAYLYALPFSLKRLRFSLSVQPSGGEYSFYRKLSWCFNEDELLSTFVLEGSLTKSQKYPLTNCKGTFLFDCECCLKCKFLSYWVQFVARWEKVKNSQQLNTYRTSISF